MHPVLVEFGSITLHTYGILIAVGFIVALQVVKYLSSRHGLDVSAILDLCFWSLVLGLIGARALFVITQWDYFSKEPMAMFRVWEGGMVFFGGPLLVVPFALWFCWKKKLNAWKVADVLMPGLALAHAFGRLGCLASGCCYGKPTDAFWGVRIHSPLVEAELRGIPLHPTQLYESFSLFLLFLGLLWIFKNRKYDGQVGLTYFLIYPIIRSTIEIYRGDLIRGFVVEDLISTSQFISMWEFAIAAGVLFYRLRYLGQQDQKAAL